MDKRHKLDSFKKNEGFKLPEGYFDSLNSRVMNSLPIEDKAEVDRLETVTLWTKLKPITYLAAMFMGAALIIKVVLPSLTPADAETTLANDFNIDNVTDEFIQETIDGAMLDEYSMYLYLSDNIDDYEE